MPNSQGGRLYIGKNDRGETIGISNDVILLGEIPNKVRDLLGIMVDVNHLHEDGKDVLEIIVEPYPYPVSHRGRYYYRSGSTMQELKGSALDRFLLKKHGLHWDGVPVPHLSAEVLSDKAFSLFAEKAVRSGRLDDDVLHEGRASLLRKLHLFEGDYVKRAAALLFHDHPEQFTKGAYVKIGFFRTDADLVYQDEIHGNLFQQVDQCMDLLLTKYMKAYISYEGLQRVERYPFPVPALREALLNAIVHKDYSSANPVQISVYEDQIVFWNAGRLPEELPLERLQQKHPSIPYNPLVASTFFRAGYIEAWGRGIEKINIECRQAGIEPPAFNYDFGGLMLTFRANPGAFQDEAIQRAPEKTTQKTTQKILSILKTHPTASRKEIAEMLGDISEDGVKYQLNKMKNQGLIERVGPAKGGIGAFWGRSNHEWGRRAGTPDPSEGDQAVPPGVRFMTTWMATKRLRSRPTPPCGILAAPNQV